jgi:hypothetical protein
MNERRTFCGNNSGEAKCLFLSHGVMLLLLLLLLLAEIQQIILMEKAQCFFPPASFTF